MFLKTEKDLITYIKEELGWPQLNVELTDRQLQHCIYKAIQMFADFAMDDETLKYVVYECSGKGDYFVDPSIQEIVRAERFGTSYQLDLGSNYIDYNVSNYIYNSLGNATTFLIQVSAARSLMEKYVKPGLNYTYNKYKGVLSIHQNYVGKVILECHCDYIPDEFDKIYNNEWVKGMAVAQARLMQSSILGKYSHSIVNGAQINYADIRARAETEITELKEELKRKWMPLAPVLIG